MNVAKARRDATIARIRQTEASLRAEQVALGYTRILAPFDGVVGLRYVSEGSFVNAATRIATASASCLELT